MLAKMLSDFKKNIIETWDGYYHYDKHSPLHTDAGVPFTIELKRKWFGKMEGTVQDDFTKGGMKEKGKIIGKMNDHAISFIKRMPKFSAYDELGNSIKLDIPHPLLHYKGSYNSLQKKYEGAWRMDPMIFRKDNRHYKSPGSLGIWEMTRRDTSQV